jgi:hypothetical protein
MRYLITWPNRDQQIIEGLTIQDALKAVNLSILRLISLTYGTQSAKTNTPESSTSS